VRPVLTPAEMAAVDARAPEPTAVLVARAGQAVARAALGLLGGGYGRRVVVVAGKGNNGADGRDAARRLARRGVRVSVVAAAEAPLPLPACDLVVDAAYGTGFHGAYVAPDPAGAPVLAVDIPSGVDGTTGAAAEAAVWARATVAFAALKPGLLLHPGRQRAGSVAVADIGLDVSGAACFVVEPGDVGAWLPARDPEAHKWQSAVVVAAGSAGMQGAAALCTAGAQRAGAGIVVAAVPGATGQVGADEVITRPVPAEGWAAAVLEALGRARALVVGPGLGRAEATAAAVRHVVARAPVPVVVDADGLWALGEGAQAATVIADRRHPTVLTPHAGEFARLAGSPPDQDRLASARVLAERLGAVVLLKGSTTVVADPGGPTLVSTAGGPRLATAGTGDVLAGVIAAFLARGVAPARAAAAAAVAHGLAARRGPAEGLVAGDVVRHLPTVLAPDAEARDGRVAGDG